MVEIRTDCPDCGAEVIINYEKNLSWEEGFEEETKCPECGDKMKISYQQQGR